MQKEKRNKRAIEVLFSLIELYLKTGKPVASNTLKEEELSHVSSATIRNYFAELEELGLLEQMHTSGGRIPTKKAFELYAENCDFSAKIDPKDEAFLSAHLEFNTVELQRSLDVAVEALSEVSGLAALITSPRFDRDFIKEIRLFVLDSTRLLSVIITQFSVCYTDILHIPKRLSSFSAKRIESFFKSKLQPAFVMPELLTEEEHPIAMQLYQEISLRFMVRYANFTTDEVQKAGLYRLLNYTEFHDPALLGSTLSLMENPTRVHELIQRTTRSHQPTFLIADPVNHETTILSIPYQVHGKKVGVIALYGPMRIPYPRLFALLNHFKNLFEKQLDQVIASHNITLRTPETTLEHNPTLFLESYHHE
ncbi:MAG: heat-inducible transcriptional repressor HrcA [Chlamydiia bacterium]